MPSLNDIFYKEFNAMMRQLPGYNNSSVIPLKDAKGNVIRDDFPIPDALLKDTHIIDTHLILINNIDDDYYSKLNGVTGLYYPKMAVKKRKFDYKGEYIVDDYGNPVTEDVTVPQDCIAVFVEKAIGVPLKYKPQEEGLAYVDKVFLQIGKVKKDFLLYVIPKRFCYKVHQTALVLKKTKFTENTSSRYGGKFYMGREIAMTNGATLFMYIIPYDPIHPYSYRVVATSTNPDNLLKLANQIYDYWVKSGKAFNPIMCDVTGCSAGVENMAHRTIEGTISTYVYSSDKSIDNTLDFEVTYDNANVNEEIEDDFGDDGLD